MKKFASIALGILICECIFAQASMQSKTWSDVLPQDKISVETVKTLLASGIKPNALDKNNSSLLYYVSDYSASQQMIYKRESTTMLDALKYLFSSGASLVNDNENFLYGPILFGAYNTTSVLLDNGADPNAWKNTRNSPEGGASPLEVAYESLHENIADLLIAHGAAKLSDYEKNGLLFVGAANELDMEKLITLGENGNVNVDVKDKIGDTAVGKIAGNFFYGDDSIAMVQYLINKHADLNIWIHDPSFAKVGPPLSVIIQHRKRMIGKNSDIAKNGMAASYELMKMLLENGAFVSGLDSELKTPLHYAAMSNDIEAAHLLVPNNAKISSKDRYGKTPLDYAEGGDFIMLLKAAGAQE